MDSKISVSGLISGIQWRDMISQIVELEARPVRLLEAQVKRTEERSSVWSLFKGRLAALQQAASALDRTNAFRAFTVDVAGGAAAPLSVSAGPEAVPGRYQVRVLAVAAQEKLAGQTYGSATSPLGVAGEFSVNGVVVRVAAGDSLRGIADRINAAGGGVGGAAVSATVVSTSSSAHRLVLTSTRTGAAGIDLVDGAGGVLRQLGVLDETVSLKHQTSAGARGDVFTSASSSVASLLGFVESAAGAVQLGGGPGFQVFVDLDTMSLADVAAAINEAAAQAGSGVTASVIQEGSGSAARYRLDIHGTTTFTDSDTRVLEALGVLRAGRSSVAQELQGGVLTAGGAAAGAATRLVDLDGGAVAGETLRLAGTRADGSQFDIGFQITATTTLADVAARLNAADAFGGGDRPSAATVENGRIVVRDVAGGESRLALSILAHNEAGGLLDFGEFQVSRVGYTRELARGADAELELDGAYLRRSQNTIEDTLPGLRLDLRFASPGQLVDVNVTRDHAPAVEAVRAFVEAYNSVVDFVAEQFAAPADGAQPKPLYGDGVLRSMRSQLLGAMQTVLPPGLAGQFVRMGEVGVQIGVDGRFRLDSARLMTALRSAPDMVFRLFGTEGVTTGSGLSYVASGAATRSGRNAIEIQQLATRATATTTAFAGTYVDDGSPDRLVITDEGTGSAYSILLENGMSTADIVERLNAELGAATRHRLALTDAWLDSEGEAVTDDTVWADVRRADGAPVTVDGSFELTVAGTRHNGSAFLFQHLVQDAGTSTVGELRARLRAELGSGVDVRLENGQLTVERIQSGQSQLSFSIASDQPGSEPLFGPLAVVTPGRRAAPIHAYEQDGQLRISHGAYGSQGFTIRFEAGGADGTASLGLVAGTYWGTDVAGTIGGHEANGVGQQLVGAAGTPVDGLAVQYAGEALGEVGDVSFSRGVAGVMGLVAATLLGSGAGSIDGLIGRLDQQLTHLGERIERAEVRFERRREQLIRRFAALETALSRAQSQSQWLSSYMGQLVTDRNRP